MAVGITQQHRDERKCSPRSGFLSQTLPSIECNNTRQSPPALNGADQCSLIEFVTQPSYNEEIYDVKYRGGDSEEIYVELKALVGGRI